MIRKIYIPFTPTFWKEVLAAFKSFLADHVSALSSLGMRGGSTDIDPTARFGYPEHIFIGDHCVIGYGCHLYAGPSSRLDIDDHTLLGPRVFITTDSFSKSKYNTTTAHSGHAADVRIGKNVRIGAHAVILPGVVVGDNAAIGAGSVVTEDIPAGVIAAGNPAKVIKPIE